MSVLNHLISFTQRPIARTGLIVLGAGWAVFVSARYVTVDDGFLIPYLRANGSPIFQITTLAILVWVFGLGLALGYAAGRNFQGKTWLWPAGLIIVGGLGFSYRPDLQQTWQDLAQLQDGLRASLLIGGAALLGAGLGLGGRLAKQQPPVWFVAVLTVAPFVVITLKAGAVARLLALIWLFVVAEALGHFALKLLERVTGSTAEFLERPGVVSVGTGLSLLSLITLGLGLVGMVAPTILIIFLLLMTALLLRRIRDVLGRLRDRDWRQPAALSTMDWCGLLMLTGLFAVFWTAALAPEVGADALGLRIAMPAMWLQAGRISPLPEMMLSYGFAGAETLYLLVMPLAGFTAARVVTFGLAVLVLASACFEVFPSRRDKHLALWLFAFWGSTLVWWQFASGFVDLVQMFFYCACMLAVWMWLREPCPVCLAAAGMLGATATVVKLSGAGALAIAGVALLGLTLYRSRSWRLVATNALWLAVPAAFIVLPWLARSYWLTGNPVFPFGNQIFKSPLAPLDLAVFHFGPGLVFPGILTVSWGVFFNPGQYAEIGTYHPFLLAMLPLALVGLIGSGTGGIWWLAAGGLAGLSWLVTEQNSRYSLYAVYLLWLAAALGLARLITSLASQTARYLLTGLALAVVLIGFWVAAMRPQMSWWVYGAGWPAFPTGVVLGGDNEAGYLRGQISTYFCADWLNRHYGDRAKVWQVSGRDHLYFASHTFNGVHSILPVAQPLSEILVDARWRGDLAAIHQRLLELGYTHLMYDAVSALWSVEDDPNGGVGVFSSVFQQRFLELECADRGLRLYKLRAVPAPVPTTRGDGEQNRLHNPGFEILTSAGQPDQWTLVGQARVTQTGSHAVAHLEPDAYLYQPVQVEESRLYELELDIGTDQTDQAGYVQINWLDQTGRSLLSWKQGVSSNGPLRRYHFMQTAPPGSDTAMVYLGGPAEVANVDFHEITTH